jgi:hypothetical protein
MALHRSAMAFSRRLPLFAALMAATSAALPHSSLEQ